MLRLPMCVESLLHSGLQSRDKKNYYIHALQINNLEISICLLQLIYLQLRLLLCQFHVATLPHIASLPHEPEHPV